MYPSQDVANTIGNLIAWGRLLHTSKLAEEEIEQFISKWQSELLIQNISANYSNKKNRLKP